MLLYVHGAVFFWDGKVTASSGQKNGKGGKDSFRKKGVELYENLDNFALIDELCWYPDNSQS